jgi:hypothetical protein
MSSTNFWVIDIRISSIHFERLTELKFQSERLFTEL